MERPRGVNLIYSGDGSALCYKTSRRRTVRLGSLQEVYERFPNQVDIGHAGLYRGVSL